jgi:hypothetical protein
MTESIKILNTGQSAALAALGNALLSATECGALDELVLNCNSPDSINDVCDAVHFMIGQQVHKPPMSVRSDTQICRKITLVIRGDTEKDFEETFDTAVELLANGCATGQDSDETAGFYFKNEGNVPKEEVPT